MVPRNFLITTIIYSLWKLSLGSDLYSDVVRKYDSEIFSKNVGGHIPHFVNFFAPWCGYCKRLKPVWDELAERYNVDSPSQTVAIVKVDCTAETPLCAQEGVSGYPSLMFYNAGEKKGIKYQGKRDTLNLEEFIKTSIEAPQKQSDAGENPQTVKQNAVELNDDDFHATIDWGLHFVKFYAPWCGHCQRMAGVWEELAEIFKNDKSITISNVDCTANKKTCSEFEVKGYPTLLWIVNGKKVEKYMGTRDLKSFKEFISEMKQTHIEAVFGDEEKVPEQEESEPDIVVQLSSQNFENAIEKGLSFVKFYTPWCGHSSRLAPIWNQLAVKFVSNTDVKIAKVDCNQEEELCNKYKVVGYPTLLLFRNGEHLKEFLGNRKLEELHSFVIEHLHHDEL